jgi:hypothetical protein
MSVVRLCSEDAEKCGGVNRWLFVNGEFIHSTDNFFKMICLCDPQTISNLEKLCMNVQLGISYLADFFKGGQFLESLDRQAVETELVTKCESIQSKLQSADESVHSSEISDSAWKKLNYGPPDSSIISRIPSAFQIALDGVRRGCDRCRGIIIYILMTYSEYALEYRLPKPVLKFLIKYHLSCIRTQNKYTFFVNGIHILRKNNERGIQLIEMAADLNLEIAECWMGQHFEEEKNYAKMFAYYSESAKRTGYLPAILGQKKAVHHFKCLM